MLLQRHGMIMENNKTPLRRTPFSTVNFLSDPNITRTSYIKVIHQTFRSDSQAVYNNLRAYLRVQFSHFDATAITPQIHVGPFLQQQVFILSGWMQLSSLHVFLIRRKNQMHSCWLFISLEAFSHFLLSEHASEEKILGERSTLPLSLLWRLWLQTNVMCRIIWCTLHNS